MNEYKSIDVEKVCYVERPSKNLIESILIKVSDSYNHYIECIEIAGNNINDQKLILTIQNYHTGHKEILTISFSLFIKNKPTNKNEGLLS